MVKTIRYKGGYKYQLQESAQIHTDIVGYAVDTRYLSLSADGWLCVRAGYCWDGATWCPDLKSIMRGSLFHDALYQLMRLGLIDATCREMADKMLRRCCLDDGMNAQMAAIVYHAVRRFAASAARSSEVRTVMEAP